MSTDRIARMHAALSNAFDATQIDIQDESHLHAGHVGAQDGRGHFDLKMVSTAFAGLTAIARHRLVYQALDEMMTTDIHALRIQALTPDEADATSSS